MARKKTSSSSAARKKTRSRARRLEKSLQTRILEAALPDVMFDGWTQSVLESAGARIGLDAAALHAALPNGVLDLVLHFSSWADEETLARLSARAMPDRIRDRITLAVRTRLEILAPHKDAVSAALTYLARPPRGLHAPKAVWKTADAFWRWAGDTATDYNYYTKRLLLSGVLTATCLYWLNDASNGHDNTWAFLDRRIARVMKIGQKMAQFKTARRAS